MTNDQLRIFVKFAAFGSLLESEGVRQSDIMTEKEETAVQAWLQPLADLMTDAEAESQTLDTAKTLFRESLDELLAIVPETDAVELPDVIITEEEAI